MAGGMKGMVFFLIIRVQKGIPTTVKFSLNKLSSYKIIFVKSIFEGCVLKLLTVGFFCFSGWGVVVGKYSILIL